MFKLYYWPGYCSLGDQIALDRYLRHSPMEGLGAPSKSKSRSRTLTPDLATSEFLRFYFLTTKGLEKLGKASPGGAGRNRTLGLKKLDAIEVPVPPISQQRWFDHLNVQVKQVQGTRERTAHDVGSLIPALLHQMFNADARKP